MFIFMKVTGNPRSFFFFIFRTQCIHGTKWYNVALIALLTHIILIRQLLTKFINHRRVSRVPAYVFAFDHTRIDYLPGLSFAFQKY